MYLSQTPQAAHRVLLPWLTGNSKCPLSGEVVWEWIIIFLIPPLCLLLIYCTPGISILYSSTVPTGSDLPTEWIMDPAVSRAIMEIRENYLFPDKARLTTQ